jgi:hypothetical protein
MRYTPNVAVAGLQAQGPGHYRARNDEWREIVPTVPGTTVFCFGSGVSTVDYEMLRCTYCGTAQVVRDVAKRVSCGAVLEVGAPAWC